VVYYSDICGNISSIFGGLLAYGFDTVSGAGGLSGWQWYGILLHLRKSMLNYCRLFLTEGIATVVFGVAIWFLLPDCKSLIRRILRIY
jgi:hypothetical protein